ncbi:MAG: hypothetical protein IKF42_04200 [Mogibacterium sp.]|nr:hypothetical protein [Mogibacterium sp.]
MYKAIFGTYDSITDYGLILTNLKISSPQPKRTTLNIPNMDGVLDLTPEPLHYSNRTIDITFKKAEDDFADWEAFIHNMMTDLHGKTMDIAILSENEVITPNTWYWRGVVLVSGVELAKHLGTFIIRIDAYPYQVRPKSLTFTPSQVPQGGLAFTITNNGVADLTTLTATQEGTGRAVSSTIQIFVDSTPKKSWIARRGETLIVLNEYAIPGGQTASFRIYMSVATGQGNCTVKWEEVRL